MTTFTEDEIETIKKLILDREYDVDSGLESNADKVALLAIKIGMKLDTLGRPYMPEPQHKITPLPEQSWKPAGPNPELSPNALFDDLTFIEDGPAPPHR